MNPDQGPTPPEQTPNPHSNPRLVIQPTPGFERPNFGAVPSQMPTLAPAVSAPELAQELTSAPMPVTIQESVSMPIADQPTPLTPPVQPIQPVQPFQQQPIEAPLQPAPSIIIGGPGTQQTGPSSSVTPKKKRRITKKTVVISSAVALVLLLSGGAVFGLYLPNRPENAYKKGFSRTGMALEQMSDQATESKAFDQYKRSKIVASLNVSGADDKEFDATFSSDFDDKSSSSNLAVTSKGGTDGPINLKAQLLTELSKDRLYPDLYVKVSGISALGADAFLPGATEYENKWIQVSSAYLKSTVGSIAPQAETADTGKTPTSADIAELSDAFFTATNEHVFTSDADKAVFQNESFVGKEKSDGLNLFHYTVRIDTENAKAYCVALSNGVINTKAYKNVTGDSDSKIATARDDAKKDCEKDNYKNANKDKYDLWIDAKYKLIHKFRVTDSDKPNQYTEFGQTYKGGDDINFFVSYTNKDDDTNVTVNLATNLKELSTVGTIKGSTGKDKNAYTFNGKMSATASKDTVKITKPTDAISIETIMQAFGGEAPLGTETVNPAIGVQSRASDSKRQADIKALQTQLEAFYASNNFYPTFSNLNSSAWRATNMKSLDSAALSPNGESATLALSASQTQYGYAPTCDGSQCTAYTLTALLGSGTPYIKVNLD